MPQGKGTCMHVAGLSAGSQQGQEAAGCHGTKGSEERTGLHGAHLDVPEGDLSQSLGNVGGGEKHGRAGHNMLCLRDAEEEAPMMY